MYKTGLVSVTFRELSVDEIIALCNEAGLDEIEWGSDVHAPYDDIEKLGFIAKLQKEKGISCCSYGTYFRLGVNPVSELDKYIAAAKILGTDILRIWCGDENYDEMSEKEQEFIISEAKKAAETAEKEKVVLCSEWHNQTFTNCIEGGLRLIKEVNSPAFLTYWQPNKFKSIETNLEYAKQIAPYTKYIHVFNWDAENRYPLSEQGGVEAWRKYLACFDGTQKLLLEFMPDNKPESLKTEAYTLKNEICVRGE